MKFMTAFALVICLASTGLYAQSADEKVLGWRTGFAASSFPNETFFQAIDRTAAVGRQAIEASHQFRVGPGLNRPLDYRLNASQRAQVKQKLAQAGIQVPVYDAGALPAAEAQARRVLEFARDLGASAIIAEAAPAALEMLDRLAGEFQLKLALRGPGATLAAVNARSDRIGVLADSTTAVSEFKKRVVTVRVTDAEQAGLLKAMYGFEIQPAMVALVSTDAARSLESFAAAIRPIATYHTNYVTRTAGVRRSGGVSPEEAEKIRAALPATAPAKPKKPRKLLIVDANIGRGGHPSIPHANMAVQLMGEKTKAWETTISHDVALLAPETITQFDAIFFNNTIGPLFGTPERREAFRRFIENGGGMIANHAATVTETDWPEFGEILGARGASHRMTDEKVTIKVEHPNNPIVSMFGNSFVFADEIFRFQPPYSRERNQVLLSIDVEKTDLNQGRCYGQCMREDNDYAIAWIRRHGKGRVFYNTIGHNPYVFWDPGMLKHFQAAIQWALGDLEVPER